MSGVWIRNTVIVYEPKEPKQRDIANAIDHNCSFCVLHGNRGSINLCFYSITWLWTTTHSKIRISFHFWFKRKSCLCIKWAWTDNASSFVMQELLIISGRIHCITVTQCGVEPFNLWPPFFLSSQHVWLFSRFYCLMCRSVPRSRLAICGWMCACCARWLDCVRYGCA